MTQPIRRTAAGLAAALCLLLAACAGDDTTDDATDPPPETPAPDPAPGADEPDDEDALSADSWVRRADAPLALTEIDAEAYEGEIWTVGGFTEGAQVTTEVQVYAPETDSWRAGPPLPVGLHHASLVATDTDLVVVGGYEGPGFGAPTAGTWILDDDGEGWSEGVPLPEARGAGGAAWDGERVVFGGGMADDGVRDEVWAISDPADGEWVEVGTLSVARDHLDATSDGEGAVFFLGGRQGTLVTNLGTVDLVTGDEVTEIGELPTPRGGVAAFWSPVHGACLAGGEQPESTFAQVECIDAEGTVTVLPDLEDPRHGLGAAVVGDVAYVLLGGPEPLLAVSTTVEALRLG